MDIAIDISALEIGYQTRQSGLVLVAGPMNLEVFGGELASLIGPNGSGKTTLIRTISTMQEPLSGQVQILGKPVRRLKRKELSKMLSLVLTEQQVPGNMKVRELVSLGRYPHTGWFAQLTPTDIAHITWAMKITGIMDFANRTVVTLSDGERQKVMIARALAQDTPAILLDEPTAHLDIPNRVAIIILLRKLARETGKAILMSTHELELALQASDRLWLIRDDKTAVSGTPEDLVLEGEIERTFSDELVRFDVSSGTFKMIEEGDNLIAISGVHEAQQWTRRALERIGYISAKDQPVEMSVQIVRNKDSFKWLLSEGLEVYEFNRIGSMIHYLRSKEKIS